MSFLEKIYQSEHYKNNALSGKVFVIGLMALLLMIPGLMVKSIMLDRQDRSEEAQEAIHEMWSGSQSLIGPLLEVPYATSRMAIDGGEETQMHYFYALPEELDIRASMKPEIRRRGIFETILFVADVSFEGSFDIAEMVLPEGVDAKSVNWGDAKLLLSASDARGVNQAYLTDEKGKTTFRTYSKAASLKGFEHAMAAKFAVEAGQKKSFSLALKVKGSGSLGLVPVGGSTQVEVQSSWHSPSFTGKFLPDTREISDDGFLANWKVSGLSRGLPESWSKENVDLRKSELGVKLMMPVSAYTQSLRVVSYAFLFVVFTFGAIFCAERISGVVIHLLQYLISGTAIMIFYVLLLSLAEQMNFSLSYLIAAATILLMIVSYLWAIIAQKSLTFALGGMLILMYSYFYVVLQCEDYALLMGSVGLVCIVATVMYLTRNLHQRSELKAKSEEI